MDKLAIVVPCYNEEEVLKIASKALREVLDDLIAKGKIAKDSFILFVNDGSKDNTYNILVDLANKDKRIKVIDLSRNFGQQPSLLCGFKESKGEAVIDIDVDLQDRPEAILHPRAGTGDGSSDAANGQLWVLLLPVSTQYTDGAGDPFYCGYALF